MADPWLPGAQRLPLSDVAPCDAQYPPKAIAHITWDKNATKAAPQPLVPFENLRSYFSTGGASMAPHVLWDPFTGRFAQFYPATSRSKSVVDVAGGTRTNRAGKVVIQIEAVFFPWCVVGGKAYERLVDTPCAGWSELHAWVNSWGVPDSWPMGRPVSFDSNRSESVWESRGGWYGHSQVPENDHQDPGSWPDFIEETDMTPAQEAKLDKMIALLEGPGNLAYRNSDADAASVKAGHGHIPDVYGYTVDTNAKVSKLAVGGVDLDALAVKVVDLFDARLKS